LVIDKPESILPAGSAPLNLSCGVQQTRARIGYVTAGAPAGTDGLLRLVDPR
jgi:hypothetical protein